MKQITVYNYREFDEAIWFQKYSEQLGLKLVICKDAPDMENARLAEGSECVVIITSKIDAALMERFSKYGVNYIATRTIGYEHIDLAAAKKFGIKVGNATYGPEGVADYTVMLMLMSIRKMKRIMERTNIQDYTLQGIQGRELRDLTIGVIGTGRIGQRVIQNLSGFGCKILAYDFYQKEEVKAYAEYTDLETIWKEADLITFHTPLTEANFHMVNEETLAKMKEGVILVNTARGGLIDTKALIEGIQSGKVGAVGLDVVEDEFGLYYYDHKSDILDNRYLGTLRGYPNVTVTHHMAFYTDNAIESMVRDSLTGCALFLEGKENPWEVA